MPDARQCGACGYGPMIHRACDDLTAHHGEVSDDNTKAAINNSCPGCGYLASTWSEWVPWNGMLPTSLQGSAFCLGTVDDEPAKVLTAQEAIEARLKALEKSLEVQKAVIKPAQPVPKKTTKEQDELDLNATKRMLELERQRRKNEKELLLKRFKADRG